MTHLLDDDLLLLIRGELSGPDLLHAVKHLAACAGCRERAAPWVTEFDGDGGRTFSAEVEETIALVESEHAPIAPTIAKLETFELALHAAAGAVEPRPLGLDHKRGRVLFCRAWLLMLNGSLAASREAAIRARDVFASLGDEVQLARTLVVEACVLAQRHDTSAAITAAREATSIFIRHDEPRRARTARSAEGTALELAGRHAEAAEIFQDLLETSGTDDRDRLHWRNNLAMCFLELGDHDRAEEMELALLALPALTPEIELGARWVCAVAQARRGHLEAALELLRSLKTKARMLERRPHEVFATYTMAEILSALDRPQEAAAMAREVITYFTEENIPSEARAAVALLREATTTGETNLLDELESFRQSFPELFPRIPALRSTPSRPTS